MRFVRTFQEVLAVGALSVIATACSVPSSSEYEQIPNAEIPFDLNAASTTSTIAPSTTTTLVTVTSEPQIVSELVDVFFVSNSMVIRTQQNIVSPATATQTLAILIAGPSAEAATTGLRSAVPKFFIASVDVLRGVATIDAGSSFLKDLPAADQKLAIAQLVLTLTSRPGIGQVLFSVDGVAIAVPRGRGDLAAAGVAVTFDDYTNLIAQEASG